MLETVFICGELGELKPDLTTTAHFAIQLSYPMSNLQHSLQARAGGLTNSEAGKMKTKCF